ncbi:MAG: hypothetical protein R2747_20980 [Pyrinomonadaceae bacterium]
MFIFWIFAGFAGVEIFSYAAHRWLFHGPLWRIHRSHHVARRGLFEANDLFTLLFSAVTISLLVFAESPLTNSVSFPLGLGIALYGLLYFIAHDLFTHRRFLAFRSKNGILLTVRAAHQRHHQTAAKRGIEPFGLFLFNFGKFRRKNAGENPGRAPLAERN